MKKLIFLALLALPLSTYAMPAMPLFGTQKFTPNTNHTVTGPLVQLQTATGSVLSFQQGARFKIDDTGTITLNSGNLRIGPVGNAPLTLNLPQGPVTVAPQTALTVTVQNNQTTGRIYQGNLEADGRTFSTGQGFMLNSSGAHGTFTPAPAQTPSPFNLAALEPAAGPAPQTPPTTPQQPDLQRPFTPITVNPVQPTPKPGPETNPTPPQTGPAITPTPEPQPAPQPEPQPQPEPVPTPQPEPTPSPQPEPTPEPEAQAPTTITRPGLYAAFSQDVEGIIKPDNNLSTTGNFLLSQFANGTQTLTESQSVYPISAITSRLNQGSALNLNATSHGTTSGLGRWVGGQLVAINTAGPNLNVLPINNTTTTTEGGETIIHPNSLHYVWGELPTAIPTSGRLTYNLFSATQPTYTGSTGNTMASQGGIFTGNLAIDFSHGSNGVIGTYHFNGTVSMPETTTAPDGTLANSTSTYTIANNPLGSTIRNNFANTDVLNVNATAGAAACPTGCTGTVNVAGFGVGVKDAGALYTINPGATTGITGAALFTAAPAP